MSNYMIPIFSIRKHLISSDCLIAEEKDMKQWSLEKHHWSHTYVLNVKLRPVKHDLNFRAKL